MIGMLTGTVALKDDPAVILDVNGVGYRVFVPQYVLLSRAAAGEKLVLFIHTHVREDLLELYGFLEREDLRLFEQLINVSGVGCKSALGIFSVGKRSDIVNAIIKGDVLFFTAVPRLGKKNSQKIIIDLKNKIAKGTEDLDLSDGAGEVEDEVLAALQQFGFSNKEAIAAIRSLDGAGESVSEKVKLALKYLGR
jgi:holliday junction DNA helicase RuvA